jgi:sterol desaturase/sphingolipid hydroxylase (fatty acid hydroxylase superfamily)
MPENMDARLDMLMRAFFLLTVLLYLAPAALGPSARGKLRWMGRAAIWTLGLGLVLALVASARWFVH